MTRKVRHPHQVLEASEMVVGQLYAFVTACRNLGTSVSRYTMGGMFDDTHAAARQLGHDLNSANPPKVEMLLIAPPAGLIVTVHMDGWRHLSSKMEQDPTLMYWRECFGGGANWDMMWSYLGPEREDRDRHTIVVSSQHWDDDPRLHSTNWHNPDGVIERAAVVESAAGWERMMRAKAHAAMAKALGF